MYTRDRAQAALGFLIGQLTYVEQEVLRQPYPEIRYPRIIPVDTSAPEWIESIAFKTMDFRGEPAPLGDVSHDFPLAEVASSIGGVDVHTFSLGYTYTLQEVGKAMEMERNSVGGSINYLAEKPAGARMLTEQFLDKLAFRGDARLPSLANTGLLSYPGVPVVATGALLGGPNRTIAQIIAGTDPNEAAQALLNLLNNAIMRVYVTQTNSVFRPTHILMPLTQFGQLSTYRIPNTSETMISYLERVMNVTIEPLLHATGAGVGGSDRMMVYSRDEKFVKFHLPMPYTLEAPVVSHGGLRFEAAGLVRTAGTELRIPQAHLYVDQV